jgi:protoheme ferro-lyase
MRVRVCFGEMTDQYRVSYRSRRTPESWLLSAIVDLAVALLTKQQQRGLLPSGEISADAYSRYDL